MFTKMLNSTIEESWPILLMIVVTLCIMRILFFKNHKHRIHLHEELLNLIFIVYIYLLFTLLSNDDLNSLKGFNLRPFEEIMRHNFGTDDFNLNVFGNIIIFIPLGFYISYYLKKNKIFTVILSSVLISSTVEIIQYFIGRSFDIDDIILNVAGAIVGLIIFVILNKIRKMLPKFLQKDGLLSMICIIILIALVIYFLSVLGVTFI